MDKREILALWNSFLGFNRQFSTKTFTGHFIIANKTWEGTACAHFSINDCAHRRASAPLLSFPEECARNSMDKNATWSQKALSQPAEKLEAQTSTGLGTEFGIKCGLDQEETADNEGG